MASEITKHTENQLNELTQKVKSLNEEILTLLTKFQTCYVDTKDDFRINTFLGATEIIFEECEKRFERGENLIKMVNRITKSNIAHIDGIEDDSDNIPSIDSVLAKFAISDRKEIFLKVMGEKIDGEMFLLEWQISRLDNIFRHYFKIVPTNQIIKLSQEKHTHDLSNLKELIRNLINMIDIGIVVLDVAQRIIFINEAAKSHTLPNQNNFIKNANFDTKHFKDLIFMVDQEDMNFRLDTNKSVLDTKRKIKYDRIVNEEKVEFEVVPLFDKTKAISGIAILSIKINNSKVQSGNSSNQQSLPPQVDVKKLLLTIKHYTNQNKVLYERINELETNQKWFMKNSQSFESTIKTLYSHIDNIPFPIQFIEMPDQKTSMINASFIKAIKADKKAILGKLDNEIFPDDIAHILAKSNEECAKEKILLTFNLNDDISVKQAPFMDFGNNKIVIARVFNLANNNFDF